MYTLIWRGLYFFLCLEIAYLVNWGYLISIFIYFEQYLYSDADNIFNNQVFLAFFCAQLDLNLRVKLRIIWFIIIS